MLGTMKSVAVYCGSAHGNDPHFTQGAHALGVELARRDIELVYGGGKVGLMGEVANAVLEQGGRVTGVIPVQLADKEMAHPGLTRLETVATMAKRKTRMEELAEGFIAMPGGVGTLEELAEVLTMQQLGNISGPVGLFNVSGYWQPFYDMFAGFVACGFVQRRYLDGLIFSADPVEILDGFEQWQPLGAKWE